MDADPDNRENNERRPTRRRHERRHVGARARMGPRKKGYWKSGTASTSTSDASSTEDVETSCATRSLCDRTLIETHDCYESDGISGSTTDCTTDSENVKVGNTLPERKRKSRSHVAYLKKRKPKTIGFLRIDDGVEDRDNEDSESDDGENDTSIESVTQEEMPGDISLSDIEIEDLENILKQPNAAAADCAIAGSPVTGFPGAGFATASDSDTGVSSELVNTNFSLSGVSKQGESGPAKSADSNVAISEIDSAASGTAATIESNPAPSEVPEHVASSSARDPNDPLAFLSEKLKLLLPSDWTVDVVEDTTIRVFTVNKSQNPSIPYSIFYDSQIQTMGVFVHGIPVPRDHQVFNSEIIPDLSNLGSIADYISGLVQRILLLQECQGIQDNEEGFWETSNAVYLDYSSSLENPCYRHAQCAILMPKNKSKSNICFDCRQQKQKFQREQKKRELGELDPSTIPDKYLTKEGMKAKKNKFRMQYREEKQRADRLEKRVESLKIKLDEVMSDELSAILRSNQHKMTPLQKLFWEEQMKVLALDDKRGMRWHPMLIRLALHLHSLSDAAYEFINESKIFTLPSSRRLYDYSHFIEATEGCQPEITEQIKEKIRKCGEEHHYSFVNLMFDEMHIRSGLVFSRSTGELIGYTNLSGVEEELQKNAN